MAEKLPPKASQGFNLFLAVPAETGKSALEAEQARLLKESIISFWEEVIVRLKLKKSTDPDINSAVVDLVIKRIEDAIATFRNQND